MGEHETAAWVTNFFPIHTFKSDQNGSENSHLNGQFAAYPGHLCFLLNLGSDQGHIITYWIKKKDCNN